mmetsp:Transcript_57337/g.124056  ORF Transcript_57337/g.124056 Transcript_57337/m.124056 type:complete len:255 (-) Transcript_57337:446-1210(-)
MTTIIASVTVLHLWRLWLFDRDPRRLHRRLVRPLRCCIDLLDLPDLLDLLDLPRFDLLGIIAGLLARLLEGLFMPGRVTVPGTFCSLLLELVALRNGLRYCRGVCRGLQQRVRKALPTQTHLGLAGRSVQKSFTDPSPWLNRGLLLRARTSRGSLRRRSERLLLLTGRRRSPRGALHRIKRWPLRCGSRSLTLPIRRGQRLQGLRSAQGRGDTLGRYLLLVPRRRQDLRWLLRPAEIDIRRLRQLLLPGLDLLL